MEIKNDANYTISGSELNELGKAIALDLLKDRQLMDYVRKMMIGSDNRSVSILNNLSPRLISTFEDNGIETIQDILNIGRGRFTVHRNLGRKSIEILSAALSEVGHNDF